MSERGAANEAREHDPQPLGDQPTMAAQEGAATERDAPAQPAAAVPSTPASSDWTGREVCGRYRVLERMGEGGMGVVYLAEHLTLQKKVALKVIHPELSANEDLLLRFKREALATGQLDHPHIAAAIDFDAEETGVAFLVMPWVRGDSLQTLVDAQERMPLQRAALLGSQIADALSAAHAMGIVHRDLKPDNVLIEERSDGSEAAKVLDFGVAALAGVTESISVDTRPLTQAGTILGTPGYMSPEQASAGDVDHRTDLYALGVILWELCRGERLFSGDDITQIFAKQFKSLPAALELGFSGPAREMSALVGRLLAWNKQDRPETAAEVRDVLRRLSVAPEHPLLDLRDKQAWARKYAPLAAAGFVLLMALMAAAFSGDDAPADETEAQDTASAAEAEKTSEPQREREPGKAEPRAEPEREKAEPEETKLDKRAARGGAQLTRAKNHLMTGRTRKVRRDAARTVLRHADETPRYLQLVADMELATGCAGRRAAIDKLGSLGDRRALPSLKRLSDTPRRGCGLLRLNDCQACLRRNLQEAISALER